jgi:outer membrane protein OmpA-like peptidoglycan-associated protein
MMADADGDGIADDKDQCPATASGARVDGKGCEFDSDNDGVLDSKDQCPSTISGAKVDVNGCAMASDSDGDGVMDDADRCPGTASGAEVNQHGCAVDMDDDGDGIANQMDACPGTAAGTAVDLRGCELQEDLSLNAVEFSTGTADLSGESQTTLDNIVRIMNENPHLKFEVGGHTDDRGAYEFNMNLSEKRAAAVRNYLVEKGIDADRLTAEGYGPNHPLVDNDTAANRQKNRRVELKVQ